VPHEREERAMTTVVVVSTTDHLSSEVAPN
jgi:hypothetical protein